MTCASIALAILAYPDWLTAFGILFVAAVFGASVCWLVFEWRYAAGIAHQRRQDEIDAAFKERR